MSTPVFSKIQEPQNKKTRAKIQTEGGGKKCFKEGKYAISIIDDKDRFTKQGNVWMLEANDLNQRLSEQLMDE